MAHVLPDGCGKAQRWWVNFPTSGLGSIARPRGSASHLAVTILKEPVLVMSLQRAMVILVAALPVVGFANAASAQTAQSKAAKPAPKAAAPAKAAPKSAAPAKPAAPAAAGNAEPSLIGQFGTWGAYTATPNGKKVCFALAKPSSSKTNPPNRPRSPRWWG